MGLNLYYVGMFFLHKQNEGIKTLYPGDMEVIFAMLNIQLNLNWPLPTESIINDGNAWSGTVPIYDHTRCLSKFSLNHFVAVHLKTRSVQQPKDTAAYGQKKWAVSRRVPTVAESSIQLMQITQWQNMQNHSTQNSCIRMIWPHYLVSRCSSNIQNGSDRNWAVG